MKNGRSKVKAPVFGDEVPPSGDSLENHQDVLSQKFPTIN